MTKRPTKTRKKPGPKEERLIIRHDPAAALAHLLKKPKA
jgi:hypothetical protein